MSVTSTWWAWVKSIGDALVTAGHFDAVHILRSRESVPSFGGQFRRILLLQPVRTQEIRAGVVGMPQWEGTFRITAIHQEAGLDGIDPFEFTGTEPGIMPIADLIRDSFDTALHLVSCKWTWGPTNFEPFIGNVPQKGSEQELTVTQIVMDHARAGPAMPPVTVPATLSPAGIQQFELIVRNEENDGWAALTGSFGEVNPAPIGALLKVGVLQMTKQTTTLSPTGSTSGFVYPYHSGAVRQLRVILDGVTYKADLTTA